MNGDKPLMQTISNALDMTPLPQELVVPEDIPVTEHAVLESAEDAQARQDFEDSRQAIKKLAEMGSSSLERLQQIADSAESARAYEVLFKGLVTVTEMHEKLLDLHATSRSLVPPKPEEKPQVTNNLFVGTPSDLLDLLEKRRAERAQLEGDNDAP